MTPRRQTGRPDYPTEAARRATILATDGLTVGRAYLESDADRHPDDRGRAFEALAAQVDAVLVDLADLAEAIPVGWNAEVPAAAFDVLDRADQAFVDLIVGTHIEDQRPRLHGPQSEMRVALRGARGPVGVLHEQDGGR